MRTPQRLRCQSLFETATFDWQRPHSWSKRKWTVAICWLKAVTTGEPLFRPLHGASSKSTGCQCVRRRSRHNANDLSVNEPASVEPVGKTDRTSPARQCSYHRYEHWASSSTDEDDAMTDYTPIIDTEDF